MVAVVPVARVCEGMVPTGCGARLARLTVTLAVWVAVRPPRSRAVTVTVALPTAPAEMVTTEPSTEIRATPVSDDDAE